MARLKKLTMKNSKKFTAKKPSVSGEATIMNKEKSLIKSIAVGLAVVLGLVVFAYA
jgi:hypothetical protein